MTGTETVGTTAVTTTVDPTTTTTTGVVSTGTDSDGTTGTTGDTDTDTGVMEPCKPGDNMMGMIKQSLIWVPVTDQGTITKIDTITMTDLARYRSGPNTGNDAESPSRTAVSADGRFVVVNNRRTNRSTMIAANIEDCIDKNNNGMIETSANPANILAWGTDECVIWSTTYTWDGNFIHGARGVTWTPGEWDEELCQWVEPKLWIGYHKGGGIATFVRLDGMTGAVELTIDNPGWISNGDYAPYGAALDPQFRPWFGALRGEIARVNTDEDPVTVTRWTLPANILSYGFTVDKEGHPWMAGYPSAVSTFDPDTQQVYSVPGTATGAYLRGIAIDNNFQVWAASNSPCRLVQVDGKSKTLVAFHNLPNCNTAIGPSVDLEGFLWVVDYQQKVWKIDTKDVPGAKTLALPGLHYVYSDMTGGQLLSVIPL
ncbi:MAG: lyase [Nannocystaceae bacterium]